MCAHCCSRVDENALRDSPNDVTILWRAGCALYNYNYDEKKQADGRACVERAAARTDTVVGQVAAAYCMICGWGRSEDRPGAAQLLSKLADVVPANPDAQFLLGVCHFEGWGVLKNEGEAVGLYSLAAHQGHALAQYLLGVCFANGEGGIPQHKGTATQLWRRAAAQGHLQACRELTTVDICTTPA